MDNDAIKNQWLVSYGIYMIFNMVSAAIKCMLKLTPLLFLISIATMLNSMQHAQQQILVSRLLSRQDADDGVEQVQVTITHTDIVGVLTAPQQHQTSVVKKVTVATALTIGLPAMMVLLHYMATISNIKECPKFAIAFLLLLNYYVLYILAKE